MRHLIAVSINVVDILLIVIHPVGIVYFTFIVSHCVMVCMLHFVVLVSVYLLYYAVSCWYCKFRYTHRYTFALPDEQYNYCFLSHFANTMRYALSASLCCFLSTLLAQCYIGCLQIYVVSSLHC